MECVARLDSIDEANLYARFVAEYERLTADIEEADKTPVFNRLQVEYQVSFFRPSLPAKLVSRRR